jgi:hemerythrin
MNFLYAELARLREHVTNTRCSSDCALCPSREKTDCQQEIDGFCLEFIDHVMQHFMTEDDTMRQIPAPPAVVEAFEQHIEAHADMMGELAQAVGAPTPCRQSREVFELIQRWLAEHGHHDELLRAWLQQPQPA